MKTRNLVMYFTLCAMLPPMGAALLVLGLLGPGLAMIGLSALVALVALVRVIHLAKD